MSISSRVTKTEHVIWLIGRLTNYIKDETERHSWFTAHCVGREAEGEEKKTTHQWTSGEEEEEEEEEKMSKERDK